MKKITVLLAVMISALLNAQEIDSRIEHILKEKLRPVKVELPTESDQSNKTTSNQEHKLSTISSSSVDEAEGFIAMNPNDSSIMVLSYMSSGAGGLAFPVYYTTNGGATWTKSSFNSKAQISSDFSGTPTIVGGGDPVFAYDDSGKLYFSYIYLIYDAQAGVAYFAMYWATSMDNGQTFTYENGQNHFIGYGGLNPLNGTIVDSVGDGVLDRQWMAVDNTGGTYDGRLYTTGLFIPNGSTQLNGNGMIIKYKDANDSAFSTSQTQVSVGQNAQFGNVVVASNGDVHVTYVNFQTDRLYHRRSTNGGQTFAAQTQVYDGYALFGQNQIVVHSRENAAPNLVIGPDNTLHLAWCDIINDTVHGFYSRSTDDGTTWSQPIELSNYLAGEKDNLMPHVAVDKHNNPSISWYGVDENGLAMFYNVQSQDGGLSFLPAATVSTVTTDFSNYGNNDFFGDYCNSVKLNCKTFTIWSDGRNNAGPKMYVATVDHCASVGIAELTPLDSDVELVNYYPNPVHDFVTLELKSSENQIVNARIVDITGKLILENDKEVTIGNNTITLNLTAASGTYLLEVTTESGARIVRKLIVE